MPSSLAFPLQLKQTALGPRFYVCDARNQTVGYLKRELFKLQETFTVFADDRQAQILFQIRGDGVLTQCKFADAQGQVLGTVERQGTLSSRITRYVVSDGGTRLFNINEKSTYALVLDGLYRLFPWLGLQSGYLSHPLYEVTRLDGAPVMALTKVPAPVKGCFQIEKSATLTKREEYQLLLSLMRLLFHKQAPNCS